ncbi:hypothetical protein [Dendronalium phyllosphericum]|nr:hypothetical protein [Dendronalium phyllosphericum]
MSEVLAVVLMDELPIDNPSKIGFKCCLCVVVKVRYHTQEKL